MHDKFCLYSVNKHLYVFVIKALINCNSKGHGNLKTSSIILLLAVDCIIAHVYKTPKSTICGAISFPWVGWTDTLNCFYSSYVMDKFTFLYIFLQQHPNLLVAPSPISFKLEGTLNIIIFYLFRLTRANCNCLLTSEVMYIVHCQKLYRFVVITTEYHGSQYKRVCTNSSFSIICPKR